IGGEPGVLGKDGRRLRQQLECAFGPASRDGHRGLCIERFGIARCDTDLIQQRLRLVETPSGNELLRGPEAVSVGRSRNATTPRARYATVTRLPSRRRSSVTAMTLL